MRWRQNLILRRMRGEQIEVPKEDEPADTPDQSPAPVGPDSLAPGDSTDSIAPAPEPELSPIPGESRP
jgi:hypothetical protein